MEKPWLSFYDPGVPRSIDYPEVPVFAPFLDAARRYPDNLAMVQGDASVTYKELAARVESFARGLADLNVGKGVNVGVFLPNRFETVISYYAVLRAGATAVMLSPALVEREFVMMARDAGFTHLICGADFWPRVEGTREEAGIEQAVLTMGEGREGAPGVLPFEDLLVLEGNDLPMPDIEPRKDVAVLIYTGGTTGLPKAVELTHYSVVANALQLGSWVDYGAGEAVLAALPLFHSYGMSTGINAPLYRGSTSVLLHEGSARDVIESIGRARPRVLVGVPSTLAEVLEQPGVEDADLSSLECCFVGAAPLPPDIRSRFEELTRARVLEGYGLTEAVTAQAANPLRGTNKRDSIGIPFPDVEFRIVDLETGSKDLLPEQVGELAIGGPCVMKGYHNRPLDNERSLKGGWLLTGDIAWVDRDGYFYVIDRKKDLVIAGAFKAYPAEVESVLATHPDIRESAVVGLFDDFRGHSLKAFVVRREGSDLEEDGVLSYLRENLSEHKVPRVVVFRERLPRNEMGKILRSELE